MHKNNKQANPKSNVKEQRTVLHEAHDIINGVRQEEYGDPEICLNVIANFWSVYISTKFDTILLMDAQDVCQMMALLKVSREITGQGKRDNLVDQIGYLGLIGRVKYDKGRK